MTEKALGVKEASITAQNTGTEKLEIPRRKEANISVSGTFVATVTLQRSFDQGGSWLDVETHAGPMERVMNITEPTAVRLFVKTGDFTSGTVAARVSFG